MLAASADLLDHARALLRDAAHEAGRIAQGFFRAGEKTAARIWSKPGGSPVTEADIAVDTFLKTRLADALPGVGWLSEETRDDLARLERRLMWIVDPIDGTRAFLSGDRNWSVSIALVESGAPIAGIVHAPALDAFYEAVEGGGARLNDMPIAASTVARAAGARVAGPVQLLDRLEREGGTLVRVPKVPSLALRLARVAAGEIDAGLVSVNSRDWDIAAADLILAEAGGRLTGLDGRRPLYNRRDPVHGMLVAAGQPLHGETLTALAEAFDETP